MNRWRGAPSRLGRTRPRRPPAGSEASRRSLALSTTRSSFPSRLKSPTATGAAAATGELVGCTKGTEPTHAPHLHRSSLVQRLASSHVVPSGRLDPRHPPHWHASADVHVLPSSHGIPLRSGGPGAPTGATHVTDRALVAVVTWRAVRSGSTIHTALTARQRRGVRACFEAHPPEACCRPANLGRSRGSFPRVLPCRAILKGQVASPQNARRGDEDQGNGKSPGGTSILHGISQPEERLLLKSLR